MTHKNKVLHYFLKMTIIGGKMKKTILWIVLAGFVTCLQDSFSGEVKAAKTAPIDTASIEKRVNKAESTINEINLRHQILLEAAQKRNDQLQSLLQWLGLGFIVLSVLFGGMAAVASWRQSQQQGRLIGAHVDSASNISGVLSVVEKILYSRLLKVREGQKEISQLKKDLEGVTKVIDSWKTGIMFQRRRVENTADELAKISRHDFKKSTNILTLNAFAKDFDDFRMLHSEKEELNVQCYYIRGIAAVFSDKFNDIQNYLNQIITQESPKAETDFASRKRLGNAYYYLGLNHSNLGELDDAIRFLEQAHKLDPEGTDLLTRLVMAEVYVMSGQYKKAEKYLKEIDDGLDILKKKQGDKLRNHQIQKQSRAYLIRSNKALAEKKGDWKKVIRQYTAKAYEADPDYYYASFTLGQIFQEFGNDVEREKSKQHFGEAYSKIQESGHLHFVKEIRIRILLLMVAAICGKHGSIIDERVFEKYLDEAKSLRDDLPRIDNRICTAFSPMNKQNVSPEIIGAHIEEIRKGSILLV